MAASVARAKMVLGVLKGSHILAKVSKPEGDIKVTAKMFKRMFCSFSASGGHLALLKWAQANGYPWDKTTCTRTAEKKHLEVLQWARAQSCPWDEWTCAKSAENGHLEVLQWARNNEYL